MHERNSDSLICYQTYDKSDVLRLLHMFKPTQCITEIGHQSLLGPKEFSGIEFRYDLDERKIKQLRVPIHMQYCKALFTTDQVICKNKQQLKTRFHDKNLIS